MINANVARSSECCACGSSQFDQCFKLKSHTVSQCLNCFMFINENFVDQPPSEIFDDSYYQVTQSEAFNTKRVGVQDPSRNSYEFGLNLCSEILEIWYDE